MCKGATIIVACRLRRIYANIVGDEMGNIKFIEESVELKRAVAKNAILQELLTKYQVWMSTEGLNNDQFADLAYVLRKLNDLASE